MDHWRIFMKLTLGNWNVRFYELRTKEKLQTKFLKDRQRSFHQVCYLQLENFTKLTLATLTDLWWMKDFYLLTYCFFVFHLFHLYVLMIIHCFDFNSVELFEFIFDSELVRMEENNLHKGDITCVRQSMYRERRKLFPAQQKNREEFHEILEDIGMVTNKHENLFL